jgi:eukaryotic-like serine/threonine-protein kinase
MTPEFWERMKPLFQAAIDKPTAERPAFLASIQAEEDLLLELQALVKAFEGCGSTFDSLPAEFQRLIPAVISGHKPGDLVAGRFRIVRWLGRGGMGDVYEALDLQLSEPVALKTIRGSIADVRTVLARFKREVQLARRLSGPNICRIHEFFFPSEREEVRWDPFFTMELLDGVTLAEHIHTHGPLPWPRVREIALEICAALEQMHAAGIIHRDLKTRNVMLARRNGVVRAVLMDFGLARELGTQSSNAETALTTPGTVVGTPAFMAPEQFSGGALKPATDIYSMGVVLYEMLTGQSPFSAPDAVRAAILRAKPPAPPSSLRPGLPKQWDRVIGRCLQFDSRYRYQSAAALTGELSKGSSLEWIRRHPLLSLLLMCASLGIIFLAVWGPAHLIPRNHLSISPHDRVLMSDFDNRTGDPRFTGIGEELLTRSLIQSHYFDLVPRSAAEDAANQLGLTNVTHIDVHLARRLCDHENYKAYIFGQIDKTDAGYKFTVGVASIVSLMTSRSETEVIRSPDDLFAAVDRIAVRLRGDLGESIESIRASSESLSLVTTPSLEALQRYSRAVEYYREREYSRSISLGRDALELDSHFAMAHLLLGHAFEETGNESQSRSEYQAALANIGSHATEREKHLIIAANYASQGMNENAADEYQLALDVFPDDLDALQGLSSSSYWAGRPMQALQSAQRAISLDPYNVEFYDTIMGLYIRTNRFDDAIAALQAARSHNLQTMNLRFQEALARWGLNDLEAAQTILLSLDDGTNAYWRVLTRLFLGKLQAYEGHFAQATDTLESGLALAERPGWESWIPVFRYQIAEGYLAVGKQDLARSAIQQFAESAKEVPSATNLHRALVLCLAIGDRDCARNNSRVLSRQVQAHPDAYSEMNLYSAEGDIELAQGHAERAIEDQRKALAFFTSSVGYQALGKACEAARQWSCALDAYHHFLDHRGEVLRDDFGADVVLTELTLARVEEAMGERNEARESNREFRTMFADCDKGLPAMSASDSLNAQLSMQ